MAQQPIQKKEDITSKSGQAASQVNKTQEMHSQQGREPGLRNVNKDDKSLEEKNVDEEDEEIVGENEDTESSSVRNFKDTGSQSRP